MTRWLRSLLIIVLGLSCTDAGAADTFAAVNRLPRIALVIGNAAYADSPLKNAVNDANAVAARLKSMGFDVTLKLNATKTEMDEAIRAFGSRLRQQNGVGLFYFAGHGAQLSWRNYMIPVDARISTVGEMQKQAIDVASLLDTFEFARTPVNIVILDACRDNPLGKRVHLDQKGFSQIDAPPGTLLAYATAPGNVAADGARANGLYTEHLLKEMHAEVKIEDVLKRVRLGVRRESRGQQIPWESTSLEHDFYFVIPASIRTSAVAEDDKVFEQEALAWDNVAGSQDIAALEAYLRRYPSGRFAELAQFRLDRLLAAQGEKRVEPVEDERNPFSKGTVRVDTAYAVGDEYRFRRVDRLTTQTLEYVNRLQQITDTEVMYDQGRLVTDHLGNSTLSRFGTRERARQYFISEYAVGKKWTTRFSGVSQKGTNLVIEIDLAVVTRERINVPAGTFDAFKVVGRGTNNLGNQLEYVYWIAPERVRRFIAQEMLFKNRDGTPYLSERSELVAYRQLREPRK